MSEDLVTKSEKDKIGEKLAVILYTDINHPAGTLKQKQGHYESRCRVYLN